VKKKEDYHFEVHHIDYKRSEEEEEHSQEDPYELLKKVIPRQDGPKYGKIFD
jgi:hypothetical protein